MKHLLFFLLVVSGRISGSAQAPDLNFFLDRAKAGSPLLADYRNQAEAGRIDSQLIRAANHVQVNGISNNYYAPTVHGFGYDQVITNGGQLSGQVQASKVFLSKGNLASQYLAVQLVNQGLVNNGVLAEKDLRKTITAQFILVYGDLVTRQFNEEVLALFQNEEKLLKQLTQANIYKQADYLTFYVSLQQQQLTVSQSVIQYKNDYATLNYLAGIVDTSSLPLAEPALETGTLPDVTTTSLYRQYTLDSLALLNDRKTIDYAYKPRVNMFADAGYNSSLMYDAYKNFGLGFGLNLSVPIYDGRQRSMKYKKIDIAERTRGQYKDFFLRQYGQQVAQLRQQLAASEGLIADINGQIRYAHTLVEVNQKLLQTGEVRITDVILAINTYLNAQHLLTQNRINKLQIINQISYWEGL